MPQTQTIEERIKNSLEEFAGSVLIIIEEIIDSKTDKETTRQRMNQCGQMCQNQIQALVDEVREGLISEIRHTTVAYDDRVSDDLVGKRLRMFLNNEETNDDTRRIEQKRGS